MSARKGNSGAPRDPIAERAAKRLSYVQKVAIERLGQALERATKVVEVAAGACVGLSPASSVGDLREATRALHSCVSELAGALETLMAEGAALETVACVREAMAKS